jgi:PAS domain S-box-containing protein
MGPANPYPQPQATVAFRIAVATPGRAMTKEDLSPVSGEAIEAFKDRVLRTQRRIASLHLRATDPQLHERQEAFAEASHELLIAVESLQVAEEELRQQQEALRQAHDDLHTERDRLLRLFHQAPDGYLITDQVGKIVEANARAGELLLRDPDRLVGKPLPPMVDEADRSRFRLLLNKLAKTDWREEWIGTFNLPSGQSFRAALTTSVERDAKGEVLSIRWSLRDISTRKSSPITPA